MIAFVVRRLLQSILVMLAVGFIAFSLFNYVGDPINNMVGQDTTLEQRQELRGRLGLDDPFFVQYGRFLANAVQGGINIKLGVFRKQLGGVQCACAIARHNIGKGAATVYPEIPHCFAFPYRLGIGSRANGRVQSL